MCDLIASGRPRIDVVLLQVSGPDEAGNYNAGIGIECLREAMAATSGAEREPGEIQK